MHLAIRVLKWAVGLAVFVATADFLGGVDLLSLVTGSGWLPAVLLSLFFSLGISVAVAFTFGVAAEWACRHRMVRARRVAADDRRLHTAEQLIVPGVRRERVRAQVSEPEQPSSPSHPRPG